jgi:hypothetical protein
MLIMVISIIHPNSQTALDVVAARAIYRSSMADKIATALVNNSQN